MVEDKKVSIILCFYNEEKYLEKAINSVLAQTYSNFELIIVNDGSTDGSDKIVKNYHDDRIVYESYEGNKRLAYARNRGLKLATGDYIGFFDGDDIMVPDKMEKQVKYLKEHNDIILVSGGYSYMDAEGKTDGKIIMPKYQSNEQIKAFILFRNCIAGGAALFRREVIDKHCIHFDEANKASEDYRFWIDMLPYGNFANVEDCFFYYRINHGSKASMVVRQDKQNYDIEVKKIMEHAWGMRRFLLEEAEISFIYHFLNKNTRIWKPHDIRMGICLYGKIKKQIDKMKLDEGKLILQYYKKQWLRSYKTYWLISKVIGTEG